jgi:hypothetical protein
VNKIYIKILNFIITSIKKIVSCTKLVYYVVKVLNNIMEVRKQRYHLYFLGHGGVVSPYVSHELGDLNLANVM